MLLSLLSRILWRRPLADRIAAPGLFMAGFFSSLLVLTLLRDGVPIRREEGRLLRHGVDRPGVYRVEVSLRVVDRWRPWIFANPIYVRA